jgi:hypothetical protein
MKTKRHTAKKIKTGFYEYRGFYIRKFDNGDLNCPSLSGIQWSIFPDHKCNSSFEICDTLADAKHFIDHIKP